MQTFPIHTADKGKTVLQHDADASTAADLLVEALSAFADRTAFVDADRRIGYAELGQVVAATAEVLRSLGLERGDGLAMLSGNRIEAMIVFLAAQIAGLRTTGLHPMGSEADHAFILDDAAIRCLVFDDDAFATRARDLLRVNPRPVVALGFGDNAVGHSLAGLLPAFSGAPLVVSARPGDIARISFTGGTTGRPKGVVHRQSALVSACRLMATCWDWPERITFLATTPLSHAAGTMCLPILMRGGTFHVLRRFTPEAFEAEVEAQRINATFLVPTQIYRILDEISPASTSLASLETVIYGAAPISPSRLKEWICRFGPNLMQLYGQVEAPNTICALRKADHDLARPERLASCGKPLAGVDVAIRASDGSELPVGVAGEICVRGPHVMEGYWQRPVETAATLKDGWLWTGDVGYRDPDGFIYLVARSKDLIITGGFNVYPKEIEDIIATLPGVESAAVIGVPDKRWGEAVKAVVVPKTGATVTAEEVQRLVREAKGDVHVPKSVDIATAIPTTPLGKPDKAALRKRYWKEHDRGIS